MRYCAYNQERKCDGDCSAYREGDHVSEGSCSRGNFPVYYSTKPSVTIKDVLDAFIKHENNKVERR